MKFRCLAFLEQQLEEYERVEHDRMEEQQMATKKILERMKQVHSLEHYFESIPTKDNIICHQNERILSNGKLKFFLTVFSFVWFQHILSQACFLCTLKKLKAKITQCFGVRPKTQGFFSQKTQSYEA